LIWSLNSLRSFFKSSVNAGAVSSRARSKVFLYSSDFFNFSCYLSYNSVISSLRSCTSLLCLFFIFLILFYAFYISFFAASSFSFSIIFSFSDFIVYTSGSGLVYFGDSTVLLMIYVRLGWPWVTVPGCSIDERGDASLKWSKRAKFVCYCTL